ncbi:MAG TPA: FxDxF family PEP-CTERM protein [Steroidobacteraceae bacterium]|nr:FxDxF family PEP-CTERM protein [Steroidobacteraceae bacterium]
MSYRSHTLVVAILAAAVPALHGSPARADMVLGYDLTAGGRTGSGSGTAFLSLPVSDTYGNTFTGPTSQIGTTGFGFYDDFIFTVSGANADAVTSTINFADVLAIDNLAVRLYSTNGNPNLPVTGVPNGGAIDAWSNTLNVAPGTNATVDVLPMTMLAPGTYVLEVAGNVTGSGGGSYSGTLNLTPVPLPAALPLVLSGLGLLGGALRRPRTTAILPAAC